MLRAGRRLAALLALSGLAACAPEPLTTVAQRECVGERCSEVNDCEAEADDFCDDCNPCTIDLNCTPCSALPEAERDVHTCTEDAELPASCAGRTGCFHEPLTTKTIQINACFPVADDPALHAGVCAEGVCTENPD